MIHSIRRRALVCGSVVVGLVVVACGDDTGGSGGAGSGGGDATTATTATGATSTTATSAEGTGGGGDFVTPACQAGYDKLDALETELSCESSTTASVLAGNCDELITSNTCVAEMEAFIDCVVAAPSSDFECDANGQVRLLDGVCQAEDDALTACA